MGEEVDKGEDEGEEGEDTDKDGERGGGLLVTSLTPPGEEEAAGLRLKSDEGVKSMSWEICYCSQTGGGGAGGPVW